MLRLSLWNERVSYLVHQNIKQAQTSTFEWTVKLMCGGKSIFEETLTTFPQIVTEISLDAAEQPKYFQTPKTNDNWNVTLVYWETTKKRVSDLKVCLHVFIYMKKLPTQYAVTSNISPTFCKSNSTKFVYPKLVYQSKSVYFEYEYNLVRNLTHDRLHD